MLVSKEHFSLYYIAEPNSGCWLWVGTWTSDGYPHIWNGVRKANERAHRVSYELYVGLIPEGFTIDHLCRVRCCVNPDHLEPVTRAENIKRSENWNKKRKRCDCGREFDRLRKDGSRECTVCQKERTVKWKAANRQRINEMQRLRRKSRPRTK
jgi:hypothetical protein